MITSKGQIKFISILSALTLVGCQQAGSIAVKSPSLSKVSQAQDIPTNIEQGPPPTNYSEGSDTVTYLPILDVTVSTESCALFLNDVRSIDHSISTDVDIVGNSRNVKVETAASVKVVGNSGSVVVLSSIGTSQIAGNSGRIYLNTETLTRVTGNSSDEICLKATALGAIEGNSAHLTIVADSIDSLSGGSGDNRITANTIRVIEGNSSRLHIYKAKISKVHGQSGDICLHDGAQIVELDGPNSAHVSSDCQ